MIDTVLDLVNNKTFDKLLDKYKGGYFGILGGLILIYMLTVGTMIYNTTEGAVTIASIWVSSLGAAKNGAQLIFMSGMLLSLLCAVPLFFDLIRKMLPGNEKQRKFFILPIFYGIGAIFGGFLLTIFNMGDAPFFHAIFAGTFFICIALMVANFSFLMLFNKDISKLQPLVGLTSGLIFLIFLLPFIPLLITTNFNFVFLITDTGPTTWYLRFWEWIAIIALIIWLMETGIFLLVKFR